jgi:hypothetical protein
MKNKLIKRVIPAIFEELSAWLLAAGFLFSIAWLLGFIIKS